MSKLAKGSEVTLASKKMHMQMKWIGNMNEQINYACEIIFVVMLSAVIITNSVFK